MTFNVLGLKVKCRAKENLIQDHGWAAYYDNNTKTICYDPTLSKDDLNHTLIHELVHALWVRGGAFQSKLSREFEEVLCEQFATLITENFEIKVKK